MTAVNLLNIPLSFCLLLHPFQIQHFHILSVSPAASSSLLSSDCSYKGHNIDIKTIDFTKTWTCFEWLLHQSEICCVNTCHVRWWLLCLLSSGWVIAKQLTVNFDELTLQSHSWFSYLWFRCNLLFFFFRNFYKCKNKKKTSQTQHTCT